MQIISTVCTGAYIFRQDRLGIPCIEQATLAERGSSEEAVTF
jgi:Glu-tRNA(Gln) amidotransferase subunit E-like FAD-binding protein